MDDVPEARRIGPGLKKVLDAVAARGCAKICWLVEYGGEGKSVTSTCLRRSSRTRGLRMAGGRRRWVINGQKPWTSGAHVDSHVCCPPGLTPPLPTIGASRCLSCGLTPAGSRCDPSGRCPAPHLRAPRSRPSRTYNPHMTTSRREKSAHGECQVAAHSGVRARANGIRRPLAAEVDAQSPVYGNQSLVSGRSFMDRARGRMFVPARLRTCCRKDRHC